MATSFGYIGNPDYRGYLNYLGSNGDQVAPIALGIVGNDGNYDPAKLQTASDGPIGSQTLKDYISNSYNTYQGYTNPTTATATASGPDTTQVQNNLKNAISTADTSLASGNQSLDNQYQSALQQLLLSKNQSQSQYDQGTKTNQLNYVGNKNTIGANAGSSLNGLLRLLGSRGAGGSSAYNIAAPQAVARSASLRRADAANNYGTNQQGLDTNWGNYLTGYNNQLTGVGAQRDQGKQQIKQSVDSQKAQLLQSLAGLQSNPTAAQPYIDQANNLLDSNASFVTPQINYQTQAYNTPSLSSYTATPTTASFNNTSGGNDYFSPYLSSLLGKKQLSAA